MVCSTFHYIQISLLVTFSEFLKQRILEENPNAPSSEIQLRVDRVEYYLGQKISSKRKSFVRRGLKYPTSEEVAAKRGKK